MTTFPYSVDIDKTIQYAQDFLKQHKLGHLPVTNKDELLGVISQRDISVYLLQEHDASEKKVSNIPLGNNYIVDLNERLDQVLRTMADNRLDSALVTRHGRLVGIFTQTDVCRSYARYLDDQFGPPNGDEAA
jgi:predicted transcriptional regulator